MRTGTTTISFGAHPGHPDAVVNVPAPGIQADSQVSCWLVMQATSTHSADEHGLEPIRVVPGAIDVTGESFQIRATCGSGRASGEWTLAYQWV